MGHCGAGHCLDELCTCNCVGCCAAELGAGNDEEAAMDREAIRLERLEEEELEEDGYYAMGDADRAP